MFINTDTDASLPNWQWVKETPVAILEENELPAWKDAGEVLQAVHSMGADMLRYPAIRWGVHSFDESDFLPKYPGLGDRDLFGEICAEMKANQVKVMAYCHYGVLHTYAVNKHPEWVGLEKDGSAARWNGEDHHYRACMAYDEFTTAMRNAIVEVTRKYPVDALYLDGPAWYGDCWCESCRSKYQKKFGSAMPDELSFGDGTQQKYNQIRDEALENITKDLRQALNERPELPILFNMTMTYMPNHRTGIPEHTARWAEGGNTTEVHRPGTFWRMLMAARLGQALDKVSMCYLPPGPYETLRNFPMAELEVLGGAYLMNGATPMLGTVSTFLNDQSAGASIREQVRKFNSHPEVYHRSTSLADVALIYSRTSGENFAGYDRIKINGPFEGAFRALTNEHVMFDTFFDTQITAERLSCYRAVMVPGGASLKAWMIDHLREYVSNGGALLASGDFTLYDENGRSDNFAAADLLGVSFVANQPDAPYRTREYRETGPLHGYSVVPEAYLKLTDHDLREVIPEVENQLTPVSDASVGVDDLRRYIDYSIVENRGDASLLADLYLPAGGAFGAPLEFPLGTPPGVTLNCFGTGRVVYCAASLGEYYRRRRLPETRKLLVRLLKTALDGDFLIKTNASPGVIMNMMKNGDSVYVNFLNYTGAMQEDGRAVEETVPVYELRVSVKGDFKRLKSIKTLWGGEELEMSETSTGISFTLPILKTFETVIIAKQRDCK